MYTRRKNNNLRTFEEIFIHSKEQNTLTSFQIFKYLEVKVAHINLVSDLLKNLMFIQQFLKYNFIDNQSIEIMNAGL